MTLEDLCIKHNVTLSTVQIPCRTEPWDDLPDPIQRPHWHVVVYVKGVRMWAGEYSHGEGRKIVTSRHYERWAPAKPKVHDVVASLFSDARGADEPFEAWCDDLGYDSDSRKAFKTYEVCVGVRQCLMQHLPDFAAFEEAAAEY